MFSPIERVCMHLRAHARVCMWLFVFIRLRVYLLGSAHILLPGRMPTTITVAMKTTTMRYMIMISVVVVLAVVACCVLLQNYTLHHRRWMTLCVIPCGRSCKFVGTVECCGCFEGFWHSSWFMLGRTFLIRDTCSAMRAYAFQSADRKE